MLEPTFFNIFMVLVGLEVVVVVMYPLVSYLLWVSHYQKYSIKEFWKDFRFF